MQDGGGLVPDVESLTGRAAIMAKQQAGGQSHGGDARATASGNVGGAQSAGQQQVGQVNQQAGAESGREGPA
jgi:hypothetical protein